MYNIHFLVFTVIYFLKKNLVEVIGHLQCVNIRALHHYCLLDVRSSMFMDLCLKANISTYDEFSDIFVKTASYHVVFKGGPKCGLKGEDECTKNKALCGPV